MRKTPVLIGCVLFLSACGTHQYEKPSKASTDPQALHLSAPKSSETFMAPDIAPISTDTLSAVAVRCRGEVNQVWQQKSSVPKEREREFHITLGIASEKCEKLAQVLKKLKETTHDEQSYQKNLEHARSTLQGGFGPSTPSVPPLPGSEGVSHQDNVFDANAPIPIH